MNAVTTDAAGTSLVSKPDGKGVADRLAVHIVGAYGHLRIGIAVLGITLPLLVWARDQFPDSTGLRGSISAYYYGDGARDVLVGLLCAIGVFLVLYKGYSRKEDIALNVAGIFAVVIALFPTEPPDVTGRALLTVHTSAAALFFVAIAYTCFFRASDTLSLIRDTRVARTYQNIYRALAGLMLLSPALAAIAAAVFDNDSFTFFFETVAVVVFGAYWIIKTIEIRQTHADRLALDGKLELAPEGLPIGCWMQTAPAGAPATWDDRIFDVDGTLVSARQ